MKNVLNYYSLLCNIIIKSGGIYMPKQENMRMEDIEELKLDMNILKKN